MKQFLENISLLGAVLLLACFRTGIMNKDEKQTDKK